MRTWTAANVRLTGKQMEPDGTSAAQVLPQLQRLASANAHSCMQIGVKHSREHFCGEDLLGKPA